MWSSRRFRWSALLELAHGPPHVLRLDHDPFAGSLGADEEDRMEDFLEDGAEGACAEVLLHSGKGNLEERVPAELELDLVERAETLVLGDHRLARLGENRDEIGRRELVELHAQRQPAEEL